MDKNTVRAAYRKWQEAYWMRQRAMLDDPIAMKMRGRFIMGKVPGANQTWTELLETFKNLQKRS
ncbi:MAG: hypothetical protein QMD09_14200 [Desulfatibacillaceae bacterium]|nr:hypothetical protein [Desulfatibacillaceae bacterium]